VKLKEQQSGREEAGWVGLWAGSGVVGEIPRSLQLLSWLSPGRFSASSHGLNWDRPTATAGGGTPKTLLRAKGDAEAGFNCGKRQRKLLLLRIKESMC
jgi:hypothetical protein